MAPVSPFNFRFDRLGFVIAYVEGCCLNHGVKGKPKRGGIGVFFAQDNELNYSGAVEGPPTSNVADIQAAIKAVTLSKDAGFERLIIKTNSELVTKSMNECVHKWDKNNWLTAEGNSVENEIEYKKLLDVSKNIEVKYIFLAGLPNIGDTESETTDIYGNKGAHHLANEGAKAAKPYHDDEY